MSDRFEYVIEPMPGAVKPLHSGMAIAMFVKGEKQGEFPSGVPGIVTDKGKGMNLAYVETACITPRDIVTGQSSGKRVHQGVTVLGPNNKQVPRLWQALYTNETLSTVDIHFWGVDHLRADKGSGQIIHLYSIKMVKAHIHTMDMLTDLGDGNLFFRINFSFEGITHVHEPGKTEGQDNWIAER